MDRVVCIPEGYMHTMLIIEEEMRMKKQNKPVIPTSGIGVSSIQSQKLWLLPRCAFPSSPIPLKILLLFLRTKTILWVMQETATELLCSLGQIAFLTHM